MRKRQDLEVVKREGAQVRAFCLNQLVKNTSSYVTTQLAFRYYKKWLVRMGFPRSKVSLDSFGRLVPKIYARRRVLHEGKIIRAIIDVEIQA